MADRKRPRDPFPPINPYTPKQYPARLFNHSSSPPPSAQPQPTATPPHPNPSNTSHAPNPKPSTTTVTAAAQPTRRPFDPWNSASTGHQRAENRLSGSMSWRSSRSLKLNAQWAGGAEGGKRVADTVGAGSEGFGKDGRTASGGWERGAKGLRERGQLSIRESVLRKRGDGGESAGATPERRDIEDSEADEGRTAKRRKSDSESNTNRSSTILANNESPKPQIFKNLTFYINGSTAPHISDHKLKHLLASHGASLSIALGRRTVTHVILGTANAPANGCGGGLAGGKMQKEIARVRGKGVKFVTVEWILESVRRGKRLPEAGAGGVRIAAKGQGSVWDAFGKG
ncbi:hypothetical protein K490DRAFT_39136 [Saccharata proteae CBS 121410]|uniref:BRCT domain-containing protein n=1 Tax=Saccharata proteae CBS 121410 TaxID=1314787 RepID=A0A9P4LXY2_9PEZI|nr:hypothetical protein K490DRAFT_39136 [Saccharata proteae CBS 121410]